MLLIKKGQFSELELNKLDFSDSLIDFQGYSIAFSNRTVKYHISDKRFIMLLGCAIYNDTLVTPDNLDPICGNLIETPIITARCLSGRFSIIYISDGELHVCSSLFGSHPIYYCDDGIYLSNMETVLADIKNLQPCAQVLSIMVRYYARYGHELYPGISRVKYACITKIDKNVETYSYLANALMTYDFEGKSTEELLVALNKRLLLLLKAYSEEELRIGLTGGRDSRLLLAMANRLNVKYLSTYTVGSYKDIEAKYAKKVANYYKREHIVFSPDKLDASICGKYFRFINDINFPCLYKIQLIEFLSKNPKLHLNTAIPETLLCHLDYFDGGGAPHVNFIKNRSSKLANFLPYCESSQRLAEGNAKIIWDSIFAEVGCNILTKLIFEQVTYQREWVYNILKIGDLSGGTACIFEDSKVLSILGHIDEKMHLNDNLYKSFVSNFYPEMNFIRSTRDCDIGYVMAMSKLDPNFYKNLPDALKNDPLEYLVSENISYLRRDIYKNKDALSKIFGAAFIENCLKLTTKGFMYNRIARFVSRRLGKRVLFNYEIIMPFCVANILKVKE